MTKIDLHVHTTFSDGHFTPEEIVQLAKENQVEVIAAADHDTIKHIEPMLKSGEDKGVLVIPALEISTDYLGSPIHMLGYKIDHTNQDLIQILDNIVEDRKKKILEKISIVDENLVKDGKDKVDIEKYKLKPGNYFSIPGIAKFLAEEKIVAEKKDGFKYTTGVRDTAPALTPGQAINAIHQAGGLAILSHPLAPKISLKKCEDTENDWEKIVAELVEAGLDGLEVYQSSHSFEDTLILKKWVEKYNLIFSAGSDWHGTTKQTGEEIRNYIPYYPEMLGDMVIPEEDLEKIISWCKK